MAYNATVVWEVRAGGSDTQCGGGFDPSFGGTDYSLQNSAQATGTVTSATTTVTATTGIFTADMVGNVITDGATYKVITAYTSSTVVTVDSAPSWTGAIIYVGGALASPGKAAGLALTNGHAVYIKYDASPYIISSTSSNVSGGIINFAGTGSDSLSISYIGYDTNRTLNNTDANRPTLQVASSGVTTVTVLSTTPASLGNFNIRNIIIDGQSKSSIRGFSTSGTSSGAWIVNCSAINCTNGGFTLTSGKIWLLNCSTSGCSSTATFSVPANCMAIGCVADSNTVAGFGSSTGTLLDCISSNNSGATTDGFNVSAGIAGGSVINCMAYNNGRDGFRNGSNNTRGYGIVNTISYGNGGWGYNGTGTGAITLQNCASGGNTSGDFNGISNNVNSITLTGNPFTNAASGDFSLNNTAGAGAACRAAGYPGIFPGKLTTSYLDIGAAQHQDSGGASATPNMARIIQNIGTY